MKRHIQIAAATAVALGLVCAPARAHYPNPGATACGYVTYKAKTDWGTGSWARGVACKEARRLAWDFRDRRYGVIDRYRCTTRDRSMGDRSSMMAHSESRCVRRGSGGRVVVTLVHT